MPNKWNGDKALLKNIYLTIKYPAEAREAKLEGFYEASFVVDQKGQMQQLKARAVKEEQVDRRIMIVVTGYPKERDAGQPGLTGDTRVLEREIEKTLRGASGMGAGPPGRKGGTRIHEPLLSLSFGVLMLNILTFAAKSIAGE